MERGTGFEVRLASGEAVACESLWAARHEIARRAAFAADPLRPADVLPAEVWRVGPNVFGGRVFVETIASVAELSETDQPGG